MRARISAGIAVLSLVLGATAATADTEGHHLLVNTSDGVVRGVDRGTEDAFLGIPYAAPPVGALRWQPPQPAARWTGIRDAGAFAPHCAQPPSPFGGGAGSENCLYLNVFTPPGGATAGRRHPVMVWIHGGSLVTGESDDYDPAKLVRDGVVVVTINYRLGALGFLAHSALADQPGGPSGDYGLMDQQAALRWVQRNIGHFGGNAGNVTVFGESAGGLSTLSQLVSPGARGMFHRAIVESGTYALTQQSLGAAETDGAAFASAVGCADQTAACLRALPVDAIVAHQKARYQPNLDGRTLTQSLGPAFASGQFARVPVINGVNHDEWRLFVAVAELQGNPVTAANYQAMIGQTLGVPAAAAAAIAAHYPLSAYPSPAVALGAVGTDAIFSCNALTVEASLSKFVPTFGYEFNDENAPQPFLPPVSFPYGAAHASELQYLFTGPTSLLTPAQERLAADMQRYWTSFARLGIPLPFTAPFWPRFDGQAQRVQSLDTPVPAAERDFATSHQCAFWALAGQRAAVGQM